MKIFGIDGGIASVGWAVIDILEESGAIIACGTRMFDAPETGEDRKRKPTNSVRREKRGMRRVIKRRRQRMTLIRKLFVEAGLIDAAGRDALALGGDPWELRCKALDQVLTGEQLAVALGHIARHRGFRSNAKHDQRKNESEDTPKMLKEIERTRDRLQHWRTVGEMFARDPEFAVRKRNRAGDFTRSILRDDQDAEVRRIFAAQRRLGNSLAREEFIERFTELAFSQRPLQDSEHLVGNCPFIPAERRCARRSYAFELFRVLSRLNTIRITTRQGERRLSAEEIAAVVADFGKQKSLSWKFLRKTLDLDPSVRFADVAPEDEKYDFVARSGAAAEGTYAIRQAVGDAGWQAVIRQPAALDALASILTFRADSNSIGLAIEALPIDRLVKEALIVATRAGKFAAFTKAGHISAAAARELLPHLSRGLVYSEACAEAGFDHAARAEIKIGDVRNPVARKAVSELLKQMKVLVHEFGLPDRVHIELARDLGKSPEERYEITRGIERRNRERDALREELSGLIGSCRQEEMLRYELWKEQNGRCLYTDEAISPSDLLIPQNVVQVDHILPWSRFGDDSYNNKTLCLTKANADKGSRTPFEWFTKEKLPEDWIRFEQCVEGCRSMKGRKKRGFYLRRNAQEVEEHFRNRNLGDTRYATRLALDLVARAYFPDKDRRVVLARPGALTAKLRRGWGLDDRKKDATGKRISDDRHHALDAIVVAACSESTLNRLTRAFQDSERKGSGRDFSMIEAPWEGFREEVLVAIDKVFVSRAERQRARREAHAATIKQVREREGKPVVFERKSIDALKLSDLDRAKDIERNAATITALRVWIESGKPKNAPPLSPKGDIIRKFRIETKDKVAVKIGGGTADRGNMVRVDVFCKNDDKGRARFFLVPVYPHQVVTLVAPPMKAVDAYKDESDWTEINNGFLFLFSIFPNSFLEVVKAKGDITAGYFKGLDRSTGKINLAQHHDPSAVEGAGARTLLSLRKFNVDRLGRVSEIKREIRTWHGAACI